jgi:hypothetical protein
VGQVRNSGNGRRATLLSYPKDLFFESLSEIFGGIIFLSEFQVNRLARSVTEPMARSAHDRLRVLSIDVE